MDSDHPWRAALALVALSFYWTLVLYLLLLAFDWLAPAGEAWSFVPVSA